MVSASLSKAFVVRTDIPKRNLRAPGSAFRALLPDPSLWSALGPPVMVPCILWSVGYPVTPGKKGAIHSARKGGEKGSLKLQNLVESHKNGAGYEEVF